jgi:hypothetical protein
LFQPEFFHSSAKFAKRPLPSNETNKTPIYPIYPKPDSDRYDDALPARNLTAFAWPDTKQFKDEEHAQDMEDATARRGSDQ